MRVHRDLIVKLNGRGVEQLAAAIDALGSTGWQRDREQETESRRYAIAGPSLFYVYNGDPALSPVTLFLSASVGDPSTLKAMNVISSRRSLSTSEYNAFLERFHDAALKPAVVDTPVEVTLTSAEVEMADVLPADVVGKLAQFSTAANKKTGSAHPLDRERWIDFIVSAHKSGKPLDSNLLSRWLAEEGSWPNEQANDLAGEYEFALEVLDHASTPH